MNEEHLIHVPLDQLHCLPQIREEFDEEDLSGLAASLSKTGQLVPIRIRRDGDRYVIIDGERRFRAAQIAGLSSLMAIVDERELVDADVLLQQLTANVQRSSLVPLEKARAIESLMRTAGWTAARVATHLGISAATVTRLLRLLELPRDVQELVDDGRIPASTAYALTQVNDPGKQAELVRAAAAGSLTRDAAHGHARRSPKVSPMPGRSASRLTLFVDKSQSVTVAAAESSIDRLITLLEDLLGKARKARTSGWELGTFARALKDQAKGGTHDGK